MTKTKPTLSNQPKIARFADRLAKLADDYRDDVAGVVEEIKAAELDVPAVRRLASWTRRDPVKRAQQEAIDEQYRFLAGETETPAALPAEGPLAEAARLYADKLSVRQVAGVLKVSVGAAQKLRTLAALFTVHVHEDVNTPPVEMGRSGAKHATESSFEPGNSAHEGEGDGERNANDGGDGRGDTGDGDGQPVRGDRRESAPAAARAGHDGVGAEPLRATACDADEQQGARWRGIGGAPTWNPVVAALHGDDYGRRGGPAGGDRHAPPGTSVANREEATSGVCAGEPSKPSGPAEKSVNLASPLGRASPAFHDGEGKQSGTSIEQEAPAAGEGEKRNGPTEEAVSNVLRVSGGVADLAAGAHGNLPNGDGQDTNSVASDRIMREESENVNADCNHAVEIAATNDCGQETGSATVVATGNLDALSPDIPTHAAGGLQLDGCSTGEGDSEGACVMRAPLDDLGSAEVVAGAIAEGDSPQRVARQNPEEDDLEIPHFLRRNGTGSALRAPHRGCSDRSEGDSVR